MAGIDDRLSPVAQEAIMAARERFVDMQINPLLESLPEKFQRVGYYPHQIPAIQKIVAAFDYVPVVVLEAPTGSGKTLIAETVRRMMKARAVYICSSKSLQDQFLHDFDYAKVVKGRSNYPTEAFPERFDPENWQMHLSADDCTANADNEYSCKWCYHKYSCPYELAKNAAIRSPLAVLNTSYFLGECNGPGRFRQRDLVIADEADTLESALMGYVSVEISERRMEKYGWTPPKKVTVPSSWLEWIEEVAPQIGRMLDQLPIEGKDVRSDRERKYLTGLWEKLARIKKDLTEENAWVYTGKGNTGGGRAAKNVGLEVSFKPSRVDAFGQEMLWQHEHKWLCMSATVISADEMMESLGYRGAYEVVRIPNVFPVKNRLVHYVGGVDMAARNKAVSWPKVSSDVAEIVARHPNDRVLVHSVSYDLTRTLVDRVGRDTERRVLSYTQAALREQALAKFRRTPGGILIAPSMDRGIDLPGDACRVQVIVKCPFPYIGDRQVSARLHSRGGDLWYAVQTIRVIVQMCGRAVRSSEDWAVTYILDSQFESNLWARYRALFPQWFAESIVWDNRKGGRNGNGRLSSM